MIMYFPNLLTLSIGIDDEGKCDIAYKRVYKRDIAVVILSIRGGPVIELLWNRGLIRCDIKEIRLKPRNKANEYK